MKLVLRRDHAHHDALLALLMWESATRGNNCGKLTLGDISDAEAQPLALPMPEVMPAGSMIITLPNSTKTVKGRRSGPFLAWMQTLSTAS